MCVIAVAPKNVAVPDEDILESMYLSNPDGAGFAYTLKNRVYVEKGFMTMKDFFRAFAGLEKKLKKAGTNTTEVPIMFHFRIGTHGPNSAPMTHPFPISPKTKHIEALDYYADVVFAHNGTIDITPKNNVSDTVQYIRDYLVPLYAYDNKFYQHTALKKLIKNTISGSRVVFQDYEGNFQLIGEWEEKPETPGVKYSNLMFDFSYHWGYMYGNYYSSHKSNKAYLVPVPEGMYLTTTENFVFSETSDELDIKTIRKVTEADEVYTDLLGRVFFKTEDDTAHQSPYYDLVLFKNSTGEFMEFFINEQAAEEYQGRYLKVVYVDEYENYKY